MYRSGSSALHGVNHNLKKGANFKTEATGKQCTSNFPKNKHFLPLDMHAYVCVSGRNKCLFFGKFDLRYFLLPPF